MKTGFIIRLTLASCSVIVLLFLSSFILPVLGLTELREPGICEPENYEPEIYEHENYEAAASQSLRPIARLEPDADDQAAIDTWGLQNELTVTADSEGITLANSLTGEVKEFPLPQAGGPGRDILPRLIIPRQITFSPKGQRLLLLTMEGYADQGADYFRLWVLNLEGQAEACTHGHGINQAAWIDEDSIVFFDYEDPSLRNGILWLWQWKS